MSFNTDVQISITKRGRGGVKDNPTVPIANRGDGIQMQFLAFLLWFISKNDTKHKYLWGYEEPEIAYEFKKQFIMAKTFADVFAKDSQIFVTTHSPAFIFNESTTTRQYRVYKTKDTSKDRIISKIDDLNKYATTLFSEEKNPSEQLKNDLWGTNFQKLTHILGSSILKETKDYKLLEEKFHEIKIELELKKKEKESNDKKVEYIKKKFQDVFPEKIFICEDKNGVKIWKHFFNEIQLNDVRILTSKGCKNIENENALLYKISNEKINYNPLVYREIDRDGYMPNQVHFLENVLIAKFKKLKHYKVNFLPVNEIENFAVLTDSNFSDEFIKKNPDEFDRTKDAFMDTAKENIKDCLKYCKTNDDKNMFNGKEYSTPHF